MQVLDEKAILSEFSLKNDDSQLEQMKDFRNSYRSHQLKTDC